MSEKGNLRLFVATVLIIVVCFPWLVQKTRQSVGSMFNAPPLWVPPSLEYRRDYDWFQRVFQSHDTAILSFPGCTIDNQRLDLFSGKLFAADDPAQAARRQQLFQNAINGRELLQQLQEDDVGISPRAAAARLSGTFLGPDGKTTCVLVTMTEQGMYARRESLEAIRQTAFEVFDIQPADLAVAGSLVDGATIDAVSIKSINAHTAPSMILASLLCLWCLRSFLFTGIIFLVALVGQTLVLALVSFTGAPLNAILIVMPGLVFVLTVSAGVHLSRYYRNVASDPEADRKTITRRAIQYGKWPCALAAITTVIGLLSLSVSQMIPIRNFSWITSTAVTITTVLLFALLPFGMDLNNRRRDRVGTELQKPPPERLPRWLSAKLAASAGLIVAGFLVMLTWLAFGAVALKSSVDLRALFRPDSRILRDYRWLEEHVGGQVSVEIVLAFDSDNETPLLKQLEWVRDTQLLVHQMEEIGGTLSAATFFPTIPRSGGVRSTALRSVYSRRLKESLARFSDGKLYTTDDGRHIWRISARVSALDDTDYGEFLDLLRGRVEPLIKKRSAGKVQTVYTGSLPVSYQAQNALLNDLFRSYLTAFVLVALVMMLVLRSLVAGVLVMLPNLFPTLLLFGLMGWFDFPVDIGSVMTASVALGIAVDDTMHFLLWYRRQTAKGQSPEDAVRHSLSHCGPAMVQTSLIVGVGLLAYVQSGFAPTQRFAQMMIVLMAAALAGDLILLPALLLSRLGKSLQQPPAANQENQQSE
jgi:predicted RND superfamily exporter protein